MNMRLTVTCRLGALIPLLAILLFSTRAPAAQPARAEVLSAMKKATVFMSENVAVRGGYVWVVSEDFSQRWGEVPARPSQIWLQGGTERVGQVLLDAYEATLDDYFLRVARKAADALVYGQLPTGGWHYFIDFDPTGVPEWYRVEASRFRYGMEEYRHFYGNATFDDHVTPDAARFLLRFYNLTREAAYREPVLKSLDFVLQAQYPNGAWPQRFPLRDDYAHDGFPDYTSFYTLNDGAAEANIELLLEAYETLGDPRYFDGALLAADALIAMQGPDSQAAWAEQYGLDMRPVAARTHEPAGYVVRESLGVLSLLARFYLLTGDPGYLAPIPRCLDWFDRINREAAAAKYPKPRYWEPGTNRPLYVVKTHELTPEGYGEYIWTTDPAKTLCEAKPCEGDGQPIVDVELFRAQYDEIAALTTPEARAAFLAEMIAKEARPSHDSEHNSESVADIIAAMDSQGAWVTDGNRVNESNAASEAEMQPTVRGISTAIFVDRMSTLITNLQNDERND
jgi:hypothetical protein